MKIGDIVVVYRNEGWIDGGVGLIRAEDAMEDAFSVASILDQNMDYWVKSKYLQKIVLDKPTVWQKIKLFWENL